MKKITGLVREHLELPNRECIGLIRQLKNGGSELYMDEFGLSCSGYAMCVAEKYYITGKGEKTLSVFDHYKKQNILVRAVVTVACAVCILHPTLFAVYALILGFASLFCGIYFSIASVFCFSIASIFCLFVYYAFSGNT